jgi:hypothetical protein
MWFSEYLLFKKTKKMYAYDVYLIFLKKYFSNWNFNHRFLEGKDCIEKSIACESQMEPAQPFDLQPSVRRVRNWLLSVQVSLARGHITHC